MGTLDLKARDRHANAVDLGILSAYKPGAWLVQPQQRWLGAC